METIDERRDKINPLPTSENDDKDNVSNLIKRMGSKAKSPLSDFGDSSINSKMNNL